MELPVTPYSLVFLFSFVVAVATTVGAWRTRPASSSNSLAAFMACVAGWLGAHALEIEATTFAWKVAWADLQWVFAALIPTLFLLFALEYTGKDHWLGRWRWLLAIEPLVMVGLLAINTRTQILWSTPYEETVSLGLTWAPDATVATAEPNIGTFVHLGYATLCLAIVSVLILDLLVREEQLYRWQGLLVLAAIAVPWAAAFLSISSLEIVGTTPIGFTITGLAITFGLYRYRLLELAPIARSEVVANLDDGVLVVDDSHRIVDCNPVARDYLEFDGTLVGERVDAVVPSDIDPASKTGGVDDDSAADFSLGEGSSRRHYAFSTAPITNGRGQLTGRTIVIHDVSDRVRRERELERANQRLEEFTSVVSHDLRNPLSVSKGYAELLEEEYDPAYVEQIAESNDRMEQLIDDMLALARQGQDAIDPGPVALDAVASAAWTTVETLEATLSVVDDPTIEADPAQLQQLLENLFRNTVEHGSTNSRSQADDSGEHGSTSTQRGSSTDESVEITVGALEDGFYVADSGCGFEPDAIDRAFESGFSTNETGTGLGLSIVAGIADRHGWSVTATESDSGGARFEFTDVEFVSPTREADGNDGTEPAVDETPTSSR